MELQTGSRRLSRERRERRALRRQRAAEALLCVLIVCVVAATVLILRRPSGDGAEVGAVEKTAPEERDGRGEGDSVVSGPGYAVSPEEGDGAAQTDEYAAMLALAEEKNPEMREFVENYEGPREPDPALTVDVTKGEIPYFTQWDSRWGYIVYGAGLMGWTGCGPTALSMVAAGLTGDGTLTPAGVADFALREGYCEPGNGTAWTLFSDGAEKLGLTAKELPLWEPTVEAELSAGRPIICIMGPGRFTEEGHYIVITGKDSGGFQVLDPFRPSNCHGWAWEDMEGEIRNLWSYEAAD